MRQQDLVQSEEIIKARQVFEKSRQEKRYCGERIPEELWKLAISLANKYSINEVSRALKLDYTLLRKRVEKRAEKTDFFIDVRPFNFPAVKEEKNSTFENLQLQVEILQRSGTVIRIYKD